jgi:CO dehydrogenase maturation factor
MKLAFVGKGGSGKTTLAALFSRYLASEGLPVLAIDADINQHLGTALGLDEAAADALPAMGREIDRIKEYLRGTNPRISSVPSMIKTTPPGRGSRLLLLDERNPVYDHFQREVQGVRLMVTGPFQESDLGLACYHSKVGAVELLLNHLLDGEGEYVVVDMTAGADSFASGMFTKFDVTFLVAEPTTRSVGVYRQYRGYARDFGVRIRVIGNKVAGDDDLAFLREEIGEELLTWIGSSPFVRAAEKGRPLPFGQLEPATREALAQLLAEADGAPRDWERFYRQAVEFHVRNARRWGNAATGEDLTSQVDPAFVLRPDPGLQAS